jgi:23S rRNA (pseudouridine1915-N3)-methyltransferase
MKLKLFYLKGKSESWAEMAASDLEKKISRFFPFAIESVKSKSNDRENAEEKKSQESISLLKKIDSSDYVVLFDEGGKAFKNSIEFSIELVSALGKKSSRIVFVIGGPYGFSEDIRKRSNARWSLSGLTYNHHVAQVVALEQIYRALTIWKGLPYHNV